MSEETKDGQPVELPELTDRQAQFVALYLGDCRLNAAEAARRMGYAVPTQEGWRLKNLPAVRAHIDAHLEDQVMSAKEVLARLSQHARGSMADIADFDVEKTVTVRGRRRKVVKDWWPNFERACENGSIDLIKKLGYDKNGNPSVELYSAQEALALIGKHHKLFTEKHEVSGPNGAPLDVKIDLNALSDQELTQLERMLEKARAGVAEPGGGAAGAAEA